MSASPPTASTSAVRTDPPGLIHPLGDARPAPGETLLIRPGLHWLRMPLPFALDHINLWAFEESVEGRPCWVAVDCGIGDPPTRQAWQTLAQGVFAGRPLSRVIVTHMHPDHVGNAQWLIEQFSAPDHEARLCMSTTDFLAARLGSMETTGHGGLRAAAFFATHGLRDAASLAKIEARGDFYAKMVPEVPSSHVRLRDGGFVTLGGMLWRCIAGHGHAPEHISLHSAEAGILLAGDMLLPRISTNVSVTDSEPDGDPLQAFLDSLTPLEALSPDTLVLPSHGLPFTGIQVRVRQLREHHAERLQELLQACRTRPLCAAEALAVLFKRPLDLHQTTFAMGEAVAHLNHLWHQGALARVKDPQGVWRFAPMAL